MEPDCCLSRNLTEPTEPDQASGRTWRSTGPHVPPVSSSTPVNHFQTSWWTGRSCCRWASVPAGEYFCNKPAGSSVGQVQSGSLVLVFLDRKWPLHSSLFFLHRLNVQLNLKLKAETFSVELVLDHHVSDFWGFFCGYLYRKPREEEKIISGTVECESPSFYPFYVCCTVFTFQTKRWRGRRLTLLPSVLTDNLPSLSCLVLNSWQTFVSWKWLISWLFPWRKFICHIWKKKIQTFK